MLPLAGRNVVHLGPARLERPSILPSDPEQDQLRDVPEVETHPTAIGTAVLPYFVPHDVGLVLKAPRLHDLDAFREQRIRTPQVQVGRWRGDFRDGQILLQKSVEAGREP